MKVDTLTTAMSVIASMGVAFEIGVSTFGVDGGIALVSLFIVASLMLLKRFPLGLLATGLAAALFAFFVFVGLVMGFLIMGGSPVNYPYWGKVLWAPILAILAFLALLYAKRQPKRKQLSFEVASLCCSAAAIYGAATMTTP